MQTGAVQPGRTLRVFVLGRFEIEQGDRLIESQHWRSIKARSLFKILLNRRNLQASRQEVAELLWPELDPDRAANNLHQAVYSLRRTLEPELEKVSSSNYLRSEGSNLQLNSSLLSWIDLKEFHRVYQQARLTNNLTLYEQAAALYVGDYLPEDLYEDWSVYQRESLRHEWLQLLLEMGQLYRAQGQPEKYRQCLHRVLESDFSHEEAVQQLMLALAESGRREESLALYRNFATKLRQRLNIEPLKETNQLQHKIALNDLEPHPTPPSPRPHFLSASPAFEAGSIEAGILKAFLPAKPNVTFENKALIGRESEQEFWRQRLQAESARRGGLTILLGEAGVGKSFLLTSLVEMSRAAGYEVLQVGCGPEPAEVAFGTLGELFRQALVCLERRGELKECLKYCSPELAQQAPLILDAGLLPTGGPGFYSDVIQVLSWLSRNRPLLLALDDLEQLAGPSFRLLHSILGHPALRSVLVLATLRTMAQELAQPPELAQLLNRASDTRQVILRLPRLQKREAAQLIATQLGWPLEAEALEVAYRLTRGNPRLTLELVKEWRCQNLLEEGAQPKSLGWRAVASSSSYQNLPEGLLTYLRQNIISRLSAEAQVLLKLAALIGPCFSFEILREIVLHRADGAGWWIELDKTRLGQVLTEVTGSGLVEEQGENYYFSYPLLAEALEAGLSHSQKRCWLEVVEWARKRTALGLAQIEEAKPYAQV